MNTGMLRNNRAAAHWFDFGGPVIFSVLNEREYRSLLALQKIQYIEELEYETAKKQHKKLYPHCYAH